MASAAEAAPVGPQHPSWPTVGILGVAAKLVHDALQLLQRLFQLVQRMRTAADAIQASVDSRAETAGTLQPLAAAAASTTPLQLLSAVTLGAATHLRKTLTDATGTMDVKWTALESTLGERMGGLFSATRDSAQALGGAAAGRAPPSRALEAEHNAAVVEQEEALRLQVFAQVYAELNAQARRGGPTVGYEAA